MKQFATVSLLVLMIFSLCACNTTKNIANSESILSWHSTEDWRANYETRSTDAVVAELKEHFEENREEIERIALAMFQDYRECSYGFHAKREKLYTRTSDGDIDFSKPIKSETADLIAKYYAKGFSDSQAIFIDNSYCYTDADVCEFCYDAFLADNGLLTELRLLYCEEDNATRYPYYDYIILDNHWQICVIAYAY